MFWHEDSTSAAERQRPHSAERMTPILYGSQSSKLHVWLTCTASRLTSQVHAVGFQAMERSTLRQIACRDFQSGVKIGFQGQEEGFRVTRSRHISEIFGGIAGNF